MTVTRYCSRSASSAPQSVARTDRQRRRLLRFSKSRGHAGAWRRRHMAMVAMAASVFHDGVHDDVAQIDTAYHTLIPVLGSCAAGVFLVSLIASGMSSSAVGTIAGQVIMQGFTQYRIPLWLRRLVTMVPAFAVVALGIDATRALILSQVSLSLVLPVERVNDFDTAGGRSLGSEFGFFERRKWKASE